ncbi:MAG: hypothetical protein CL676_12615 [Bdellovibrionaceae bacterium]|nr:hypothetical protein [Pseudobdellovibrionaceae bacterium]
MLALVLVYLSLLFSPSSSFAQSSVIDGVLIQADTTEGFTEIDKFILKGNVRVAFRGQTLSCDRAIVNVKENTVEAFGNVILDDAKTHLEADRIKMNYKTDKGEIDNGFVQSGQVIFEGQRMEKLGESTYLAEDAEFTSCTTCPAGWSFSGKLIEAELGGYAKIKRPLFKIGGIPVIPLPWLMVPLKTERQSGLLVPSYEYTGRGRWAISEDFFWALSKSQDATLGLTYHELLGLQWRSEYRYVLSERSYGDFHASFINDRVFKSEMRNKRYVSEGPVTDRWYYYYHHHFELPNGFIQRFQYFDMSDLNYIQDFPNDFEDYGASPGDPALENKASLSKNLDEFHMDIGATLYKNLARAHPLADNSDAVHKLPEINLRTSEISLWEGGPAFHTDVNSIHFTRDHYTYDDLTNVNNYKEPVESGRIGEYTRDGSFDPNMDLQRTGHRLDVTSRLQYPFRIFKLFDLTPSVAYREMQYDFQLDEAYASQGFSPTASQRYLQTELSLLTEFNGYYGGKTPFADRYKHTIIPKISYINLPFIRRPDHPFFGQFANQRFNRADSTVSDQDLNGASKIQFDYRDRVFDKDLVTFSLRNQVAKKTYSQGEPVYSQLAVFELTQFYDNNEANTQNPQPWSDIEGYLNVTLEHIDVVSSTFYNPYARLTNSSTRVNLKPNPGQYFQIKYSNNTLVDENNNIQTDSRTENIGLGLGMTSMYLDLGASVDYSKITREIQQWEYVVRLKPPGNCWYINFFHRQPIGGEPNWKLNAAFNFDGVGGI